MLVEKTVFNGRKMIELKMLHLDLCVCCGDGEGDNKLLDISVIYAEYSVFQIAACKLFAQHYVSEVVGAG